MIIGLNLHDNDFQDILAAFAKQLATGQLILEGPPCDGDPNQAGWYAWHRTVDDACKAALKAATPDEYQKQIVVSTIERSWKHFIKGHQAEDYLVHALDVTLPDEIGAKWQNGEQFYVFPTSYQEHVLCF